MVPSLIHELTTMSIDTKKESNNTTPNEDLELMEQVQCKEIKKQNKYNKQYEQHYI